MLFCPNNGTNNVKNVSLGFGNAYLNNTFGVLGQKKKKNIPCEMGRLSPGSDSSNLRDKM